MILTWLRRPLTILLAAWIAITAALKARGDFEPAGSARLRPFLGREETAVEGMVVSPAREDRRGRKIVLQSRRVEARALKTRLLAYLPSDMPAPSLPMPGETWRLVGRLRRPRLARNPGEFDERGYFADHGISAIMDVRDLERRSRSGLGRWSLVRSAEKTRRFVEESVEDAFESREPQGVLEGMLLGEKNLLPLGARRDAQDAGVMHLLVPSGTKIAFAMAGAEIAGLALGLWPWQRFIVGSALGGYYTLVVGALPPYLRAFLTISALYASRLWGRGVGAGFQALTLSALAILAFDPAALFDAGFQMTYLAVLGLLAAMPAPKARDGRERAGSRLLRRAADSLRATFVVELMLWPLFAKLFHRGPLAGALANPVAIPLAAVLSALGWGLCLARALGLTPLYRGSALLAGWLASFFRRLCAAFAHLPFASTDLPAMAPSEIALYYLLVAALLLPKSARVRRLVAAAALLAGSAAWTARKAFAPPFEVCRLWSGNAEAALLRFHGGMSLALASPGGAGRARRALRALGWGEARRVVVVPWREIPPVRLGRFSFAFPERLVLRREPSGQCDIIPLQLGLGAALISSDGSKLEIRRYNPQSGAFGPPLP